MATVPKAVKLTSSPQDIYNNIRQYASLDYQNRVPVATQNNLAQISNTLLNYAPARNEFLSGLINRIGLTLVIDKSYRNPLRSLKKGFLDYGETVQEIQTNLAKAHEYDPELAETTLFKREIPDTSAAYHTLNSQLYYKQTVQYESLRLALLSWDGIYSLIDSIIQSMYNGMEQDEYLTMKQLVTQMYNDYELASITVPELSADNARSTVASIKALSNKMRFMSNTYNSAGVQTHTPIEDQVMLVSADFEATVGAEVLATSFNLGFVDYDARRILVDDLSDINGYCLLMDKNWFQVYDKLIDMGDVRNPQGINYNYILNVWKIYSISPFSNAVLLTTDTNAITSIAITPATANAYTMAKGSSQQFSITMTATDSSHPSKAVTWSLTGTNDLSSGTYVTSTGLVVVSQHETNTTLTLTATSIFDSTKTNSITITLS